MEELCSTTDGHPRHAARRQTTICLSLGLDAGYATSARGLRRKRLRLWKPGWGRVGLAHVRCGGCEEGLGEGEGGDVYVYVWVQERD